VTTKRATYQVIYTNSNVTYPVIICYEKISMYHFMLKTHTTELQNITLHFHCSIKTMLLTKVICQLMYNIVKKTQCILSEE